MRNYRVYLGKVQQNKNGEVPTPIGIIPLPRRELARTISLIIPHNECSLHSTNSPFLESELALCQKLLLLLQSYPRFTLSSNQTVQPTLLMHLFSQLYHRKILSVSVKLLSDYC